MNKKKNDIMIKIQPLNAEEKALLDKAQHLPQHDKLKKTGFSLIYQSITKILALAEQETFEFEAPLPSKKQNKFKNR